MTEFVVIARSAFVPSILAVGPFRDQLLAGAASGAMDRLGYVSEVCELTTVAVAGPPRGGGERRGKAA